MNLLEMSREEMEGIETTLIEKGNQIEDGKTKTKKGEVRMDSMWTGCH